jgi:DNA-binding NarL/FixJ family response regulator
MDLVLWAREAKVDQRRGSGRTSPGELPDQLPPRVALLAYGENPPKGIRNFRFISTVSEICESDDVVLLCGYGMGDLASELTEVRRAGRWVPPVIVLAPTLDQRDIIQAFSRGPVSYCLEHESERTLSALVRLTAQGQQCIHPDVLRILLSRNSEAGRRSEYRLTGREHQIMNLLSGGDSVSEIATQLRLTQKTIRNNLTKIFAKLSARRQAEAILIWHGLL